jgi:sugar lactone lactonase YvrE
MPRPLRGASRRWPAGPRDRQLAAAVGLLMAALVLTQGTGASSLTIVARTPPALTVRISDFAPGQLYRVTYQDAKHRFVWENLAPDASGKVALADDQHLRPEYRLRCESRISPADPVVFSELLKAPVIGKRRVLFGVPVSTFGGPGYLVPGTSDLKRDEFANSWLYLDHPPYAVIKYDASFVYQFALLTPGPLLAHDLDTDGNLYLLHPGNWISKHNPLGQTVGAWELPIGRGPGEFVSASGMVIDRASRLLYLADEILGRVQRFSLDLELRPMPQIAWGWIGREDLPYRRAGKYDPNTMYYELDRPHQLCLDGQGHLYVSCEHYISKFDLATGKQVDFGRQPVLGWGGSFTDSAFSSAAALDGHWQRQWLAGVDGAGNLYVADRENEFVGSPRLQVFSPDGALVRSLDLEDEITDQAGHRVYITAVAGLAVDGARAWLVDAAGRVYAGPDAGGLQSGGRLFLGPGAAGRQFDLSQVEESKLSVEAQSARAQHRTEGPVLAFPAGEQGTGNCEREGRPLLAAGERSMWLVARLGEAFRVKLLDAEGKDIPATDYAVEYEEKPGLYGTQWDFFRVSNRSRAQWRNVRFVAETTG